MDTTKIIKGIVNGRNYTVTAPIVKEDYGLYLQIEGVELPSTYEVDFSNSESSGTSVTMIGNADGVLIPRQFIDTGKDIFAFLYHVGADFGRTVYKFRIPNKVRPDRTDDTPTPEEQSVIDQTISALNEAVESTQEAQEAIENMSVSAQTLAEGSSATVTKTEQDGVVHLTFGIPRGATGDSPTITASKVGDTTYIYADGVEIAQIKDGQDGSGAVEDVQINGVSIINDGTANIPIADSQLGAVFVSPSVGETGLNINNQGIISTFPAPAPLIKGGTNDHMPIVPNHQHESVFYGLAKASGDTSQAQSANPVGTYTDDAKDAIRVMLDVPSNDDIPTVNVDDVEMDGVSILQNGVAKIPAGTDTTVGVVRADGNFGTGVYNKRVFVARAYTDHIKAGTHSYRPITPICQHESAFYGLAKSAGDTTQSQSSNAVGNYTEDAKVAIQKMLGVDDTRSVLSLTLTEETHELDIDLGYESSKVYVFINIPAVSASSGMTVEGFNADGGFALSYTIGAVLNTSLQKRFIEITNVTSGLSTIDHNMANEPSNLTRIISVRNDFSGKPKRIKMRPYVSAIDFPVGTEISVFAR